MLHSFNIKNITSRWKALLLLFIPIIILSGYLIKIYTSQSFYKQEALQISKECSDNNRVECLNIKIISYISKHPDRTGILFEAFWELEKNGILNDDPRIFSDIAHDAGMTLANSNTPLDKALVFCGTTFKQGCIHGVIMEYIDNRYPSEIEVSKLFDFCRKVSIENYIYKNCLHGVGHELVVKNKAPIQTVLGLCDSLSAKESFACASGVLMEYSKGTSGSGMHSHTPIGKKDLPCSGLDDKYKPVCYASAGSYRQYEPEQEDFSKSYNFCFASPKEYINDCLVGLSERAILASAENQEKLNDICGKLESEDNKVACISSIKKLIKSN